MNAPPAETAVVPLQSRVPGWLAYTLWFAAYFAAGTGVYALQAGIPVSIWYPPVAIGTAATLALGWRVLPGILICDFAVTFMAYPGDPAAAAIVALNTAVECTLAWWLLQRSGVTIGLRRTRDIPLALGLAGLIATLAGASLGTLLVRLSGAPMSASVPGFWLGWWLGDATSMISLLPALLLWSERGRPSSVGPAPAGKLEATGLIMAVAVVTLGGVLLDPHSELRDMIPWLALGISIVMWSAVRFDRRTSTTVVGVLSIAALLVVRNDFVANRLPLERTLQMLRLTQLDVMLLSVGGLLLTSLIARERRARAQLSSAAETLELNAAHMRLAQRAARFGTWEVSMPDGRTHWSDELFALHGYPPQSFDPREQASVLLPDAATRRAFESILARPAEIGARIEMEVPARTADGRLLWCEVRGELVLRAGKPTYVGTITDVTDRHMLQRQFMQSQKMEVVGRLAGGVAHDFNNVLTAILGFSEMAQEGLEPQAPAREHLSQIQQAALRAASLTQRLLAFSRSQPQEPRAVDVDALVRRLEPMLLRLIGEDVHLRCALDARGAHVFADASQLEQVLLNLVVNSRDAMPAGGRLVISTLPPSGTGAEERVAICVSDTGTGMDASTREHIFEPFFTTKAPGQGTGLGLSTVLGIVKNAMGTIEVDSEVGQGTTFRILLPTCDPSHGESGAAAGAPVRPRGRELLLFAEDDALVRGFVCQSLRGAGYRVREAVSGEQALQCFAESAEPFDLLVTDVVMPGMNGVELARRARELQAGLRVLFISGYSDIEMPTEDEMPQAVLLHKPFLTSELLSHVRAQLDAPHETPRAPLAGS